jgi:hypothetical protein
VNQYFVLYKWYRTTRKDFTQKRPSRMRVLGPLWVAILGLFSISRLPIGAFVAFEAAIAIASFQVRVTGLSSNQALHTPECLTERHG